MLTTLDPVWGACLVPDLSHGHRWALPRSSELGWPRGASAQLQPELLGKDATETSKFHCALARVLDQSSRSCLAWVPVRPRRPSCGGEGWPQLHLSQVLNLHEREEFGETVEEQEWE